jgi:hypothetical protein
MTVTASMTPSQFFDGLISAAKGALGKAVIPPAIAFLQSVAAAPPADTVQGQTAIVAAAGQLQFALLGAVAAGAPAFVQSEQQAIAGSLAGELQALLAKVSTPPATSGSAPAA